MAPRRTHTRQSSKSVSYCDSVHTLVLSPRGSSFVSDTPSSSKGRAADVVVPKPKRKNPLHVFVRALATCCKVRSRTKDTRRPHPKNPPPPPGALSPPETAAIRRLLAPPSTLSLGTSSESPYSPVDVMASPSYYDRSVRSRTSSSSYHTAATSASARNSPTVDRPPVTIPPNFPYYTHSRAPSGSSSHRYRA